MKILCPYCFKTFDNSKAMLICGNRSRKCTLSITKEYTEYWNYNEDSTKAMRPHIYKGGWPLLGGATKIKDCPKCGDDRPDYVCPHCHNTLPKDMVQYGTDIIPVVGGPYVGKTCYIVSLLNQLNKYGWRLNLTSSLHSMYGDASNVFGKMQDDLFRHKERPPKTPKKTGAEFAPWFIKIEPKVQKKVKRPTYLIFYDIAGEQFEDAKEMQSAPMMYASGAIVLLDVLDISVVKKAAKYDESQGEIHGIAKTVDALFEYSSEDNVLKDNPIAFVFSKVDVIDAYRSDLGEFGSTVDLKQNSNFTQDEYRRSGTFHNSDFEDFIAECDTISNDFKIALKSDDDLQGLMENHKWKDENVCLFGVSSLGVDLDEDGIDLDSVEIKPYRVLDPLIWMLYKLGKIEIPK